MPTKKNYYQPLKTNSPFASETSFMINFVALIFGVLSLAVCKYINYTNLINLFIIFTLVITISIVYLECIFYPKTTAFLRWKIIRKCNIKRVIYKEVALLSTFGVIYLIYNLFPIYIFYTSQDYYSFLNKVIPWIILGSIPYFCWMDKVDPDTEDDYYKLGYAIVHFKKTMTRFEFANYVRIWLVKTFWLTLMQPAMLEKINWFLQLSYSNIKGSPIEWFFVANSICFFIDLAYASIGYILNLKILNTQTRTAEPTLFGWLSAIICYWPFWAVLIYPYFFPYHNNNWNFIFPESSLSWWFCCISIIVLEFLYALASVSAGIRFSNVTYRGLWNNSVYRLTKHPAYVFKNLSWWIIALPFMQGDWILSLRLSALLFCVNLIYYFRAKTEERHLSHYPEYEAYALEMNKKSIFRGVAKILPFLKYKPLKSNERIF